MVTSQRFGFPVWMRVSLLTLLLVMVGGMGERLAARWLLAVHAPIEGRRVERVLVRPGQRVEWGQPLALLASDDLITALEDAETAQRHATTAAEREQFDNQVSVLRARLAGTLVVAPTSGWVVEPLPRIGDVSSAGIPLFAIVEDERPVVGLR